MLYKYSIGEYEKIYVCIYVSALSYKNRFFLLYIVIGDLLAQPSTSAILKSVFEITH